jgi:hypothetical protein
MTKLAASTVMALNSMAFHTKGFAREKLKATCFSCRLGAQLNAHLGIIFLTSGC